MLKQQLIKFQRFLQILMILPLSGGIGAIGLQMLSLQDLLQLSSWVYLQMSLRLGYSMRALLKQQFKVP